MSATYIGGVSVGVAVPPLALAQVSLNAELSVKLGELNARLAALGEISANLILSPPSVEASIAAVIAAGATLQAALTNPAAAANVTLVGDLLAEIGILIGEVTAAFSANVALGELCATAGLHMYEIAGTIGAFGNDLQSELSGGMPGGSGPTQQGTAFVLLAGDNGAIAALRTVFGQ